MAHVRDSFRLGIDMNRHSLIAILVAGTLALGAAAQTIDSKIDQLGTAKYLQFTKMSSSFGGNLLVIRTDVTNVDDRDNTAYYRVHWLDESGDQVWEEEAWKPILLHGNQVIHLEMVAPTVKAKDFKIEFSADANYRK
jgi:hypothetical protein